MKTKLLKKIRKRYIIINYDDGCKGVNLKYIDKFRKKADETINSSYFLRRVLNNYCELSELREYNRSLRKIKLKK